MKNTNACDAQPHIQCCVVVVLGHGTGCWPRSLKWFHDLVNDYLGLTILTLMKERAVCKV